MSKNFKFENISIFAKKIFKNIFTNILYFCEQDRIFDGDANYLCRFC